MWVLTHFSECKIRSGNKRKNGHVKLVYENFWSLLKKKNEIDYDFWPVFMQYILVSLNIWCKNMIYFWIISESLHAGILGLYLFFDTTAILVHFTFLSPKNIVWRNPTEKPLLELFFINFSKKKKHRHILSYDAPVEMQF